MNCKIPPKAILLKDLYKVAIAIEDAKIHKEYLGLCGFVDYYIDGIYYRSVMKLLKSQLPWYRKFYIKLNRSAYWWYDATPLETSKKDCWYDVRIKHLQKVIKRIETDKIKLYG